MLRVRNGYIGYMKNILLMVLLFNAASVFADDVHERKVKIQRMESYVSQEVYDRKVRSETIIKELNVPINSYLPFIEDQNDALVRTTSEVANRAMVLLIVAVKAEGLEQDIVDDLIVSYQLEPFLSPKERNFIKSTAPSEHDKVQFIWRYEAAWTLLWALGYVDKLNVPTDICDVPAAVTFLQKRSREQFINDSKLRSISEILDESDLIYRYHWAVVDARINNQPIPSGLDESVILERHYALNWLIGYMDQEWDDISTDT